VNTRSKRWILWASVMVLCVPSMRAADEGLINRAMVRAELYVWNRLADFCEMMRCGVAVGPCVGAEVAITEHAALGAYVAQEVGVTFPHFIPPLWLVPYAEDGALFVKHEGLYHTIAYGNVRKESSTDGTTRFERDPWDVSAQLGLGIVHAYAAIKSMEVSDFAAGVVCLDPASDDQELDPAVRRLPADQFGRGASNILFGWIEVGKCMIRIGHDEGGAAGATKGLGQGLWRTACREVVGVFELVTFPFGWSPIIEPDYVVQQAYTTDWRVNRPQFGTQY
jgi:putative exosortase-associated protein (TIGR04073 family)